MHKRIPSKIGDPDIFLHLIHDLKTILESIVLQNVLCGATAGTNLQHTFAGWRPLPEDSILETLVNPVNTKQCEAF